MICSAVDWLHSQLDAEDSDYLCDNGAKVEDECPPSPPPALDTNGKEVCYWIFSHHIRNPKKRKVIVDWARELYITGCCLPGKPGIVVAEGASDNVRLCLLRVRHLASHTH